jgi:hypothetical protein
LRVLVLRILEGGVQGVAGIPERVFLRGSQVFLRGSQVFLFLRSGIPERRVQEAGGRVQEYRKCLEIQVLNEGTCTGETAQCVDNVVGSVV